jgi:hypothetical protein
VQKCTRYFFVSPTLQVFEKYLLFKKPMGWSGRPQSRFGEYHSDFYETLIQKALPVSKALGNIKTRWPAVYPLRRLSSGFLQSRSAGLKKLTKVDHQKENANRKNQ